MTDMIIGAMTDYGIQEIEPWVVSLEKSGFRGKKVMMIFNAKQEVIDLLTELDYELWIIGKKPNIEGFAYWFDSRERFNVCNERFYYAQHFLQKQEEHGMVLMTDVKDVVFQNDPMNSMKGPLIHFGKVNNNSIMVSCENVTYENEPWGRNNMMRSFGPHIYERMKNQPIWNAGVIGGINNSRFRDFLLSVYMAARSTGLMYVDGGGGPDQAALNLCLSMDEWNDITYKSSVSETFALQVGTTMDSTKNYNDVFIQPMMAFFRDSEFQSSLVGKPQKPGVYNSTGSMYSIVHQYDRNHEMNNFFKSKYSYKDILNAN